MINNIYFINNKLGKARKFNTSKKIVVLSSENDNQSGKTTIIDSIPFIFRFNNDYLNNKLNYTKNTFLKSAQVIVEIDDKKYTVERSEGANGTYEYKKSFRLVDLKIKEAANSTPGTGYYELEKYKIHDKNIDILLEEGRVFGFTPMPYYKFEWISKGYIDELIGKRFSFGIYYQLFFIEESIGWTKYDWPKIGGKTFGKYNKETINLYLYSLINSNSKVLELKNEIENKFSILNNNVLEEVSKSKAEKIVDDKLKYIQSLNQQQSNRLFVKDYSEIFNLENEIMGMKKDLTLIKKELRKEEIHKKIYDEILRNSLKHIGNIIELADVSRIKNLSDKSLVELKELSILKNEEIKNKEKFIDILKTKFKLKYEANFSEFKSKNDPELIHESIKKELHLSIVDDLQNWKKGNHQKSTETLKIFIKENVINENKRRISERQEKLLNEMKKSITLKNQGNKIFDMGKFNQKVNELREFVFLNSYKGSGALEPVYILLERISILEELNSDIKIPMFIVDTPYRGEIKSDENKKINIFKCMIDWLLNKLISYTRGEDRKIDQVFIASAQINKDDLIMFEDEYTEIKLDNIAKEYDEGR